MWIILVRLIYKSWFRKIFSTFIDGAFANIVQYTEKGCDNFCQFRIFNLITVMITNS